MSQLIQNRSWLLAGLFLSASLQSPVWSSEPDIFELSLKGAGKTTRYCQKERRNTESHPSLTEDDLNEYAIDELAGIAFHVPGLTPPWDKVVAPVNLKPISVASANGMRF